MGVLIFGIVVIFLLFLFMVSGIAVYIFHHQQQQ